MYKKTCISSAKLLKVNSGWPGIETVALVGPCLSFLRETCDFACLHSVLTTPTCFVVKRRVEFTQMYLEPMQEYVCKFRLLALSLFCVQGVIPVARLSILTHPSETLPVRKGRFPQPNRQLFGNRYSCLNLLPASGLPSPGNWLCWYPAGIALSPLLRRPPFLPNGGWFPLRPIGFHCAG